MKTHTTIATLHVLAALLVIAAVVIELAVTMPGDASAKTKAESSSLMAGVKTACFSAESWSGNDANRPCATVVAPDNDRVRVIQGTASREQAECVISYANISDARCHRIYANRAAPTPLASSIHGADHPQPVCTTLHLCATIGVPREDGSGLVIVRVGRLSILCTLSNPTEETGRYRVPCSA